ncbi:zf-TFIIB domain-containing protein [Candidatus Sumerlaeota bacterium]|nr:zf-TFIIB domain-containing protein [Candidatus Sumerlaeota bacterium]
MVVFELDGIEIDRCVSCGGTWLDAGELQMIGELGGIAPGQISGALHRARQGQTGRRKCPRCRKKLQVISVTGETASPAIELDRCPRGHGLWFDSGEMRALIETFSGASGEAETSALAGFFGDLFRHEIQSNSKGEKS